jgi:hypothetical protein
VVGCVLVGEYMAGRAEPAEERAKLGNPADPVNRRADRNPGRIDRLLPSGQAIRSHVRLGYETTGLSGEATPLSFRTTNFRASMGGAIIPPNVVNGRPRHARRRWTRSGAVYQYNCAFEATAK